MTKEELAQVMSAFAETLKADRATQVEDLAAAIRAVRAPTVLEQKEIDAALEREKRKAKAMVELAKAEEEHMRRRKFGCSHMRYPEGGPRAGLDCPKGTAAGQWTTGGQVHGNGTATTLCLRCGWTWTWKPSFSELEYINSNGLLGQAPPPADRVIHEG